MDSKIKLSINLNLLKLIKSILTYIFLNKILHFDDLLTLK